MPIGGGEEGPAAGLTLDAAIEMLVRENLELRTQFMELPQAQADVLTVSLRSNPLLYWDATAVPCGTYSPQRPGGQTQYDISVTQPLYLSRKRKYRTIVACKAKRVLEAQFQDAVRLQIDNLYTAYVDVLAARELIRYAKAGVNGLVELDRVTRARYQEGQSNESDVKQVAVQLESSRITLEQAEADLLTSKRRLVTLLNLPASSVASVEVRGTLRPVAPSPPALGSLIRLAVDERPDLVAQRLGIERASADVRLAKANRFADGYLTYAPYVFQNNAPFGTKSAHPWSVGMTVPLPLYKTVTRATSSAPA